MLLNNQSWQYKNITAQASDVKVKDGDGMLHTITFNKPTATSVITLYDNTAASTTVIGTITVPASPQPVTLIYDVTFQNGLHVKMATADSDITISYA